MPSYAAIVLSAGSGSRMKSSIPKQYLPLKGKPVIYYSLKAFQDSGASEIILVTGKDDISYCRKEIVEKYNLTGVSQIVAGGAERYDSVLEGLRAVKGSDYCMIHDGARPLITPDLIRQLQKTVENEGPCLPGMPVKDTIKVIDGNGYAVKTPERKTLWLVQTPQTFPYPLIRKAYEEMRRQMDQGVQLPQITDDAMVAEYFASTKIKLIEGGYRNIKITTPEDLKIAELYLEDL